MSFVDSLTISYKTRFGMMSKSDTSESGSVRQNETVSIPAGAVNYHISVSVAIAQLISFLLFSSQAVTIKTNSSTTPTQTFSVAAGTGITWNIESHEDNPVITDLTGLYVSNPGATAASFKYSFLEQ